MTSKTIPADAIHPPGWNAMYKGYDVVKGAYASQNALKAALFDFTELPEKDMTTYAQAGVTYKLPKFTNPNFNHTSNARVFAGTSAQELSQKLSVSIDASGEYNGFAGSITSTYNAQRMDSSSFSFTQYYAMYQMIALQMQPLTDLRPYLIPTVKEAINGTGTNPLTADEVIQTFGSHFLTGGVFGGSILISASTFSKYSSSTQALTAGITGSYGVFASGKTTTSLSQSAQHFYDGSHFQNFIVGGNATVVSTGPSMTQFDHEGIQKWVESLTYSNDALDLIDYTESEGLTPIWTLVDDGNEARADALKAAFEAYIAGNTFKTDTSFQPAYLYGHMFRVGHDNRQLQMVSLNDNLATETDSCWLPLQVGNGNLSNVPFYVANSPDDDAGLVPVYGYIYGQVTEPNFNNYYVYSIQKDAQIYDPNFSPATGPHATSSGDTGNVMFYAYETHVDGTIPVYQQCADVNPNQWTLSVDPEIPTYKRQCWHNPNPINAAKGIAFYAFPVLND
ncbi:MAC/perforin domain-containing protein [uncultured Tateyamaria sp.]|uniref:MAC/perforin domain-containing protein n=1 Tax=uncultured Tateyamaria sp. TaxID=455651 RepID=UPI00262CEC8E|nr:MAC/perforin domain-containing protein [uncultured Tateyamaria sp.]